MEELEAVISSGQGTKKNLLNHGLPEHKWCPPVKPQVTGMDKTKTIDVKPKRKYFWSKRSDEYLAKKEAARKERAKSIYKPREVLSCLAKDWAFKDVLHHIGMYDFSESKLVDPDADPGTSLTELYLFLVVVFCMTMVVTAVTVYLFEGFENVLLGVLFM